MTAPDWTPEQERLLTEIAVGERSVDDPEVVAAARIPAFAREIDVVRSVQRELEAAARQEAEDLEVVAHEPEPFAGADAGVRERLRELSAQRTVRRRRTWRPLVAAVAVLGILFWLWPDAGIPAGQRLGRGIECRQPLGTVAAYGTFAWDYELPAGGYFIVRVFDQAGPGPAVATSTKLTVASWSPDAVLPDRIRWEVEAFDRNGESLESQSAEAER